MVQKKGTLLVLFFLIYPAYAYCNVTKHLNFVRYDNNAIIAACTSSRQITKSKKAVYIVDIPSLLKFSPLQSSTVIVRDAKRGGSFKFFSNERPVDNGITFLAKGGGVWVRQYSGSVFVDWFGTRGDGISDDSKIIQVALNAAYKSTLKFTKNKVYRFINCYLPADVIVDLNGTTIKPYLKGAYHGYAMFYQSPIRINPATGLWVGGGVNFKGTSAARITVANNQILNGFFDAEGYNVAFCGIGSQADYTYIKYIKIANNQIKNSTSPGGVFVISGAASITTKSGYIEKADILNNVVKWSGANDGLIIEADYQTGTTSLKIKTIDGGPIQERVMVGRFIQVAGVGVDGLDKGNTYKTSGTVYRIIAFKATSVSEGNITVSSGDYSSKSGWIADVRNAGLRFPTVKNSWILPVSVTRFPNICIYPRFTGVAGSNILTRGAFDPLQNSYATALYPGLKISFGNTCEGFYEIESINPTNGNITIKPALASSVIALQVFVPGNLSPSSVFSGDIRDLNVGFNKFIGGSHGSRVSGTSMGGGFYNDSLKSNFDFHNNEFLYNSMNMEGQTGAPDPKTSMKSIFDKLTLSKGQTVISIPTASKYKILNKDLDNDGKAERVLVATETNYQDVTAYNSMQDGDVFTIDGVKGEYIITDISEKWEKLPTITLSRWDAKTKRNVNGGIFNDVASTLSDNGDLNDRLYSKAVGAYGSFKRLEIHSNKFAYPIDSYHLSLSAYNLIVENNDFQICERTAFELAGNKFLFKNNTVNATIFKVGGDPIPAGVGFGSGRGYGGGFSLTCADIDIDSNKFSGYLPSDGKYANSSGQFAITKNHTGINNEERFVLKHNVFDGVMGILTFPINSKKINGVSYSMFGYDYFEISKNTFNYNSASSSIILRTIHGYTTIISDNIFNFSPSKKSANIFQDMPNPEMFPRGAYFVKIFGNKYNVAIINASTLNNTIVKSNIQLEDN